MESRRHSQKVSSRLSQSAPLPVDYTKVVREVYSTNFADGLRPFDLLFSRTDERFVKFELDVYWATKGSVDPATLLTAHQSRFHLVHLKDMAKDGSTTEIGNGTIDFGEIIEASLQSGVRHYFVEQDTSNSPFDSIQTSYEYVEKLRF